MTKFGLITAMACLAFATADSLGKITFRANLQFGKFYY